MQANNGRCPYKTDDQQCVVLLSTSNTSKGILTKMGPIIQNVLQGQISNMFFMRALQAIHNLNLALDIET